jgi:gluconate 5-dehydrogenase
MDETRSLFDLTGTSALVTGSTRGLGRVMALGLAQAGSRVVVNGRSAQRVAEVADEFRHAGFDAEGIAFDVTDSDAIQASVAEIEDRIGPIDILVNNAGIQDRGALEEIEPERFKRVIEVNLTSPFLVARACARYMLERGRGKIVNICSLMSEVGRFTVGPYTASKGGLKMLTKAMAVDWAGRGLQVNAIGPGYFKTEMTQPLVDDPDFDAWVKARTPAGRWGDPEELVGPLVFLSSNASSYMNGQIIYIDGGMISVL